jgi:hypothetical protein
MSGSFEDVKEVKKPTKKIENLLAVKGSYLSEFYFQEGDDFEKKVSHDLTQKIIADYESYVINPESKLLVVFFIRDKNGYLCQQKMYYFNPEGFMPPERIEGSHLANLTAIVIRDYKSYMSTVEKSHDRLEVGFHFYSL